MKLEINESARLLQEKKKFTIQYNKNTLHYFPVSSRAPQLSLSTCFGTSFGFFSDATRLWNFFQLVLLFGENVFSPVSRFVVFLRMSPGQRSHRCHQMWGVPSLRLRRFFRFGDLALGNSNQSLPPECPTLGRLAHKNVAEIISLCVLTPVKSVVYLVFL